MKQELIKINEEINEQLQDKKIVSALVATTFKGLTQDNMKKAIFEGMMRGYQFKDFLEKNVYAIPFKDSYSLITSIDFARKIAMRSGLAGKSEPIYKDSEDGKIVSCTVTVKRNVDGIIGEYTATVFFNEYTTGKNLWYSKPRTMIAKVAEMHALRSAFPEEMSQQYVEEEMDKELTVETQEEKEIKFADYSDKLESAKTVEELRDTFNSLSGIAKKALRPLADKLKQQLENGNTTI